ncbi:MAG: XRE family transcriptional regulator [Allorhizobium sp.]
MDITPELGLAARALAKIDKTLLARKLGSTEQWISEFEDGLAVADEATLTALKEALESFGIEFLAEENGAGVGIRLKFGRNETQGIIDWESEGGSAADDDVP